MGETVPVRFEVIGVERVHGRGRLVGLAIVRLDVAGVEFDLQGVQVLVDQRGRLQCRAPVWRHPRTGQWLPAVLLPAELSGAIAAEVLRAAPDLATPAAPPRRGIKQVGSLVGAE